MRRGLAFALVFCSAACWAAAVAPPTSGPSKQTLVFYNARLALKEQRTTDVLRLWLLRNSLAEGGERPTHDDAFLSVVWAALGDEGYCQDGIAQDVPGAGLWPLALHNWVVNAGGRVPSDRPAPFNAFEAGLQSRFVSLQDVLSAPELRTVRFFSTKCSLPLSAMTSMVKEPVSLTDRMTAGRLLRALLARSLHTLDREQVAGVSVIEARMFDLDLALTEMLARQKRIEGLKAGRRAKATGVSQSAVEEVRETVAKYPENSEQAAFLRKSLTWAPAEWLSLSRDRRLFLFSQARQYVQDSQKIEKAVLSLIDAQTARQDGAEVEAWLGAYGAGDDVARRRAITSGARGERLLLLDETTGFRERSVLALHRGVEYLETGQLRDALRSFGFAMAHAEESKAPDVTMALSRRWLSFVLSRYRTTPEVIATLKALVPRQEYNSVIEDLVWRAAFHGDAASYALLAASANRGGSFAAQADRLAPLAQRKTTQLLTSLRDSAIVEPYLVLRFIRQLLDKLEAEDADVRAANAGLLKGLLSVLDGLAARAGGSRAHERVSAELAVRAQAMLEALNLYDVAEASRARALAPSYQAFAGNIRLAPTDPLPWPFEYPQVESPSAFVPLTLMPAEWRDEKGNVVFGWRVSEQ